MRPRRRKPSQAATDKKWFSWSWWWLLAIVPVLVLIALVAFATVRRRGAQQEDPFNFDGPTSSGRL